MSGLNYARMPGPGDLPGDRNHPNSPDYDDVSDELRAEMVDGLYKQFAADDDKRREAEEWVAGTFDGSHYTEVTLALFDYFRTEPDKRSTDLWNRLEAVAKVEHAAMDAKLREMAEEAVDGAA